MGTKKNKQTGMIDVKSIANEFGKAGRGYERVLVSQGDSYKDSSTVVIIPTRGMIHHRVVNSWQGLISPMNQKKAMIYAVGDEVGKAYNRTLTDVLAHPDISKWKYVLTLEDDNIQPPDAHIRLLESIDMGPFDAVSGIYFTKGEINMPMAYGDPEEFRRTGVLDFKPRDIRQALQAGNIMEVNGIAMGCSLWRMDLFRKIAAPWFNTLNDFYPNEGGVKCFTQDLEFCQKARNAGCRFAVDFRVRVGHLDTNTGEVY